MNKTNEDIQVNVIPKVKLKVFHTTYTGPKLETLQAFLKHGALYNLSNDNIGQDKGFFVWTNRPSAVAHGVEFLRHNPEEGFLTIISINAKIDPKDWDVDYEQHSKFIVAFIVWNWVLFKKIPDNIIEFAGSFIAVSKCEKIKVFGGGIGVRFVTTSNMQFVTSLKPKDSISTAETYSQIFNVSVANSGV